MVLRLEQSLVAAELFPPTWKLADPAAPLAAGRVLLEMKQTTEEASVAQAVEQLRLRAAAFEAKGHAVGALDHALHQLARERHVAGHPGDQIRGLTAGEALHPERCNVGARFNRTG